MTTQEIAGNEVKVYLCALFILFHFISFQDILYIGDHIFGDILKSKKKQGWR